MPYIFLNTVADHFDFYAPTPIILSGEYLHGPNSISKKCERIINHIGWDPVSLLTVSLAELLDTLELDGFEIVKVNRNGGHMIWILHKPRQSDQLRQVHYLKKQTLQMQKENVIFDEISSYSSLDKLDINPLMQFNKPKTKSEKSQTLCPCTSLLGGGDGVDVYRLSSHVQSTPNAPCEATCQKSFRDFQNQINFEALKTSADFECQYNCSAIILRKENTKELVEDNQINKIVNTNINDQKHSKNFVCDKSDNILLKLKRQVIDKIDSKDIINMKSETFIKTLVEVKERSNISFHENKTKSIEESNSYLQILSSNFEEPVDPSTSGSLSERAKDILDKLEKRFKNEHEYFSNVRIKKTCNNTGRLDRKVSLMTKNIDKRELPAENIILVKKDSINKILNKKSEPLREMKKRVKVEDVTEVSFKSEGRCLGVEKTKEIESESDEFYAATDQSDEYDESPNEVSTLKSDKTNELIDMKIKGGTQDVSIINECKYKERLTYKKVEESKLKDYRSKYNSVKKVKNVNNIEISKYAMNKDKIDKARWISNPNCLPVSYVENLDKVAKIDNSKSHFRISSSEINDIKNNKTGEEDHPQKIKKPAIFKKKVQCFTNKTQYDFKTRAQRSQETPKRLRVPSAGNTSTFRERNCSELIKESEKAMKNFKINNFRRNSSPAFSNKDRVHTSPTTTLKQRLLQRNNLIKS